MPQPIYQKLKMLHDEIKNHPDLTYKSIPFFETKMREIKVELLKVSAEQGEQLSRDVTDAIRQIHLTVRDDLSNISSYPKEIPKYLARVRDSVIKNLAFVNR